jgi:hypothetical protein
MRAWLEAGKDHLESILAKLPAEWLKDSGDFIEKIRILLSRPLP